MENEKNTPFLRKTSTTPYGWKNTPLRHLFGHGCVASHVARDPPPPPGMQLHFSKTAWHREFWVNPILTGGGGPPVRNPRLPRDRRRSRHVFSWVFSFKSYASFDTKFAKIGPSVARSHDVLYSHVGPKFAQNLHFAYVCVQNTWKLLIFLKCNKTVFILSFWPFAQFLISWN